MYFSVLENTVIPNISTCVCNGDDDDDDDDGGVMVMMQFIKMR